MRALFLPFDEPLFRGTYLFLNPWMYTHAAVAAAALVSARLMRDGGPLRVAAIACGTVVLFLLVNAQIADFFTEPGERVRFVVTDNVARGMTHTIAWAVFAFGLVGAGLTGRVAGLRWAGIALLGLATLKLFLSDLARLEQLYRVGALVGVAVVAIGASMLYQRFLAQERDRSVPKAPAG